MGLNPSNRLDDGLVGFKNLGDPPFSEEGRIIAIADLRAAGFPRGSERWTAREIEVFVKGSEADQLGRSGIYIPQAAERSPTEWATVYRISAELHGWEFARAWYYWVAQTRYYPVAQDVAERFNIQWAKEVRVDGCAGGQDVRGDVSAYHIDTPRGLKAFVELIAAEKERARMGPRDR